MKRMFLNNIVSGQRVTVSPVDCCAVQKRLDCDKLFIGSLNLPGFHSHMLHAVLCMYVPMYVRVKHIFSESREKNSVAAAYTRLWKIK
jgi:hypothetical protein